MLAEALHAHLELLAAEEARVTARKKKMFDLAQAEIPGLKALTGIEGRVLTVRK